MGELKGNYTDLNISKKLIDGNYYSDYENRYNSEKNNPNINQHEYNSVKIGKFYQNVIAYKDMLKGRGSFTNRFENTGIPCYYRIPGTFMSIPTGTFRYTYISPVLDPKTNADEKQGNIYMDNLEGSTNINMISSEDGEKNYYYYKEYELTGERVLSKAGKYHIGTQKHGTKDAKNFTRVAEGENGSGNFDIEARVSKPNKDPGHVWVIYTGDSKQKLERRWNDSPTYIKIDIVRGSSYDNPIASITFKNLAETARGLDMFSRQTAACKPLTMSTMDNPCGETRWVSESEYDTLSNIIFNNVRGKSSPICETEGFADYKQVRIKIGNGYILISGLLLMYLLYRFTQRK